MTLMNQLVSSESHQVGIGIGIGIGLDWIGLDDASLWIGVSSANKLCDTS